MQQQLTANLGIKFGHGLNHLMELFTLPIASMVMVYLPTIWLFLMATIW